MKRAVLEKILANQLQVGTFAQDKWPEPEDVAREAIDLLIEVGALDPGDLQ